MDMGVGGHGGTPILLDISRLLSRAGRATPTGIDRIELAYAEHLMARAGERLGFVAMTAAGQVTRLPGGLVRKLIGTMAAGWHGGADTAAAARRLGGLARLRGLLGAGVRSGDAGRAVYVLVSHQNLHRRQRLARFKAGSGAAFVIFVHDLIPMDYPEYARPGQAERHRQRVETICELADGVIVNSQATAESLAPYLTECGRRVPVVVAHPGAVFSQGPPAVAASRTDAYFVCIGTIEPRKNHLLLLHIWRNLAAAGGDAPRLVLIGQRGWENENIVDIIDRCAAVRPLLEEHNALCDRDLRALLQGARALLCPAFVEGYGLPIAEALALGVPVICSDIPVFREVGGDVPEFLDPLDGAGWMAAIRDYTAPQSPRRAAQMARMGVWRAPRWEPHIESVLALIDAVAAPAAAGLGLRVPRYNLLQAKA
jgi:glycosyltransferase involved in cell wall biosynthesis